ELEDGLGLCEERAQALGVAAGEHVGVGVRRKDRDVDREARPGGDGAAPRSADGALHLLGEIDSPALGGVLPGGVAVEGDDRPVSESDDPAAAVLYWDDQPVPEPVEDASVIPADQARGDGLVVRVALLPEVADKSVPAVRGITQPELFHRFRLDPPVGDVTGDFFAALGAPEGLAEVEMRGVVRGEEALLALLLGGVAPARQLHSGTLGEDPQGFDGLDSVQLLEPGEDVPVFATTKTVIGPPIGVDGERGRLLRVKRTETRIGATDFLERHTLADELNDVHALFDGVEVPRHQAKYRARL